MDSTVGAPSSRRLVALWAVCAALLVLGWPRGARATPGLNVPGTGPEANIPRAEDGPGVTVGQRSTLHTGAALVTGVDTNVFAQDRQSDPTTGAVEQPRAAAFALPTGWLGLGNRQFRDGLLMSPPERSGRPLDYYIGGIVGFRQYLARDRRVLGQSRISGGFQMRLAFLPGRKFSVNFDNDFFRYAQPSSYAANPQYNFNRIDNRTRLNFIGRPGGGRFSILFGLGNQVLVFQNSLQDERLFQGNRVVPGMVTEVKWRFLPKSSIVFHYGLDFTYYFCCEQSNRGRNEDNFAHRITAGYRGQILKKVTLDAVGGVGLGFYRTDQNGPDFRGPIFDLRGGYYPNPRSEFQLGIFRSFQDSLFGNYFTDTGAYFKARYEFKWRMVGIGGLWVAGRRFVGLPVPGDEIDCTALQGATPERRDPGCITGYDGTGSDDFQRRDTIFGLSAKIEQPLRRIFSVALRYDLAVDASDHVTLYQVVARDPGSDGQDPTFSFRDTVDFAGFTRHVLMLFGAVRL